jgi:nucleoside-diphosphate-sugar epimerase
MSNTKKTALVIGATGVSGRAIISHLDKLPDEWNVIGVSRNPPYFDTSAKFIPVDLMDQQSCNTQLSELTDVTHVYYAAYWDHAVFAKTREPNTAMARNSLSVIERTSKNLEHICLLQGTKYYGQYLGPFKTPAKESDPRIETPHFYYDQQDFVTSLQQGKDWTWSAARPHVICGYALGNPLNLISMICVYAAMLKKLGMPLFFPGKPGAYTSIYQATDSELLARAMIWMSTTPQCANEAFNITNGDFFRYENLWPVFADYFGMEAGGVKTTDMAKFMEGRSGLWDEIVNENGLNRNPVERLANWNFTNYAFSNDWDVMSDTTKCRKFGFLEFLDSTEMFLGHFDALRRMKIVP